ncbi:MAG: hypothetical protein PHO02_06550 [Candidatus Nanoarchaeia archaeon]|nr:hypothetical protein [Candidatus Nanoarchaeia archaeon]
MKKLLVLALMVVLVSSIALADVSVAVKRTNPGVAGKTAAQLIFDVVNTDVTLKLEGFLWCNSPDDVQISSSEGAGAGKAQYVSPKFIMDKGPSYKSMILTLESTTAGDKNGACTIKYIPFKEVAAKAETKTEPFTETATVTTMGTDVKGHNIVLKTFTEEVAAVAATETEAAVEAVPAKAELDIEGTVKTIEVGKFETVNGLKVTLNSATAENAEVLVEGTATTTTEAGANVKSFQMMNGEYKTEPEDSDYREIRLGKTVPFVEDMSTPECPEGKTECTAEEVIDVGGMKIPTWAIIAGILVIVLVVAYLLGKSSRHSA